MSINNKAWLDRITSWATIFFLIGLPVSYGFSFWYWQHSLESDLSVPAPVAESPLQVTKPSYEKLAMLFGSSKVDPIAEPVKESALSLKLVASYVDSKKGRSAAVIASSENNHQLYYQGDKLLPGVELVTVQVRRVLIKRNGVLESISLEENQNTGREQTTSAVLAHSPAALPPAEPVSRQKLTDKLNKLKALASGEI